MRSGAILGAALLLTSCASPSAPVTPEIRTKPDAISHPAKIYPSALYGTGQQGKVGVTCDIEVDGSVDNCSVSRLQGDPAFAQAALDYARGSKYRPATLNGVPVRYPGKTYIFSFFQGPSIVVPARSIHTPNSRYPAGMAAKKREADVRLNCDVTLDGAVRNCSLSNPPIDPVFVNAAIEFADDIAFIPWTENGKPFVYHNEPIEVRYSLGGKYARASTAPPGSEKIREARYKGAVSAHCTLNVDGSTHNCGVDKAGSDPEFVTQAEDYLTQPEFQNRHFTPLQVDGVVIAQPRFEFLLFFAKFQGMLPPTTN